ncbi:hypothetical protein ACWD4G_42530 [Streptomyces sp. NPDC002643]
MAGSIPAVALAVIFGIWHAYELFQHIQEARSKSNSDRPQRNNKKVRFGMRKVLLFMSAASATYGWMHMAEVE